MTDGLTIKMKTASSVCRRCGAKISNDATLEICPACLLRTGLGLIDEDFVAEVGSQDSYDSRKQQNNNRAQNKDGNFHVEPRPLINAKSS